MAKVERAAAVPQTYVVQRQIDDEAGATTHWEDIATVTVPPRTKRRTIIERALLAANAELRLPVTLRILDATAAASIPVSVREREPGLVIGE